MHGRRRACSLAPYRCLCQALQVPRSNCAICAYIQHRAAFVGRHASHVRKMAPSLLDYYYDYYYGYYY